MSGRRRRTPDIGPVGRAPFGMGQVIVVSADAAGALRCASISAAQRATGGLPVGCEIKKIVNPRLRECQPGTPLAYGRKTVAHYWSGHLQGSKRATRRRLA
jgi:hypothetical protein